MVLILVRIIMKTSDYHHYDKFKEIFLKMNNDSLYNVLKMYHKFLQTRLFVYLYINSNDNKSYNRFNPVNRFYAIMVTACFSSMWDYCIG